MGLGFRKGIVSGGVSRREFLAGAAGIAAVSALHPADVFASTRNGLLYPPMDLSLFDEPVSRGPSAFHFGYAEITWGNEIKAAIEDVSSVGFRGIQLRANAVDIYKPAPLAAELAKNKLTLVALSSGNVTGDAATWDATLATHMRNLQFLHDAGGMYLQLTTMIPKGYVATDDDRKRAAEQMNIIGRKAVDLGHKVALHNHMNSLSETPEQTDFIMAATDPRYLKLLLDVGHYQQGGGDPVKAIDKYHDRILFVHAKDVRPKDGGGYQWVELGRGHVDFPAVFVALKKYKFHGWVIVELDGVTSPTTTAKDSAEISKQYIQERLKLTV